MRQIEGLIFTNECKYIPGKVFIDNGIVKEIEYYENSQDNIRKYEKNKIIPGLVDMHLHGANGYDFCEGTKESISAIEEYEFSHGIVCFLGATMTLGRQKLVDIVKSATEYIYGNSNEKNNNEINDNEINKHGFKGIYLEGPFISANKAGAQNKEYVLFPQAELIDELTEYSENIIKAVVIAPELKNSFETIKYINQKGIIVSLGHTEADYDTANTAAESGATQITHIFNAMQKFDHRLPGIAGYALDSNINIEIIADGNHLHDATIRILFKCKNDNEIILVSDSTMATGLEDGQYYLGDKNIIVKDNISLLEDGTIAGSVSNLYDCMTYAIKIGVDEIKAIKAATINPAKRIGVDDFYGSIEVGKSGNLIVVDNEYNLVEVIK